MKRCSKCGEWKDESEFYKQKNNRDGLRGDCKVCKAKYNKEKMAEYLKKYAETHKNEKAEYWAKYREKNKDIISNRGKKYREENKAKIRDREKRRYWADPSLSRARALGNYYKYREKYIKRSVENKGKIRCKVNAGQRESNKRHPEQCARNYFRIYNLDPWSLPKELIDLKAEQIRLFRAVRDKRMGVQEHEG